jgi:ADP-ribose pyrophosphatase YjhB (NUDIX family)
MSAESIDPWVRIGAYAICLDEERRVLLCRIHEPTPDNGRWTLPGGGVEFGESPDDTVLRELEEETGLLGERGDVIGVFSRIYDATVTVRRRTLHMIGIAYSVRVTGGSLRDEIGGTTDTCAWFTEDEARALPLVALAEWALPLALDARD